MSEESDRLRKARLGAGFASAADAALALGLHYPTYKDLARQYAIKFKINVLWLLYGVGDPYVKNLEQTILALPTDKRKQVEEFIDFLRSKAS